MTNLQWESAGEFEDIRYEKADGIAKITINRPEVRNAFRPLTVIEMQRALEDAREDHETGVIILTGEGPDAFCSGGDQKVRGDAGYQEAPDSPRRTPGSAGWPTIVNRVPIDVPRAGVLVVAATFTTPGKASILCSIDP